MVARTTYVYGLIDPRDGSLRYVGKTVKRPEARLCVHIWSAKSSGRKNRRLSWLRSVLNSGHLPEIEILETVAPSGDWVEAEQFWIAYFRAIGADLCNLTVGGEGAPGHVMSEDRKAQLRLKRGAEHPRFGLKAGDDTRAKMSADARQRWQLPAHREKQSKIRSAWWTEERRAQMAVTMRARINAPGFKEKHAETKIKAMSAAECKQVISAKSKKMWEQKREAMIAAQNAGKRTPEARARASEKQKAVAARRRAEREMPSSL